MNYQFVARDLLALVAGVQGLAAVVIDLNRYHARNLRWPGHSRFHVVWQTAAFALLAVLAIVLLFIGGADLRLRFYLAAVLTGIPMVAFFGAFAMRAWYGGRLSDPDGMRPISIRVFGWQRTMDGNLLAEIVGVVALTVIVLIFELG